MAQTEIQISALLSAWRNGEEAALHELIPLVHGELIRVARRHMARERAGHTLQTAALVNEAYLRLAAKCPECVRNRIQFYAVAARLMREILVDHARGHGRAKRGGGAQRLSLDDVPLIGCHLREDVLALDRALTALASIDPRKCRVVELRFLVGLDVAQTAGVLGISENTVVRDWAFAKAWLTRELGGSGNATRPLDQN